MLVCMLQALAVADTLVLMAAIPLYVLPPIYTHGGVWRSYYDLYISIMPFLWPIYLVPYTGTIFLTVLVSVNRYEAVCRPFNTAKLCSNDKVNVQYSLDQPRCVTKLQSHCFFVCAPHLLSALFSFANLRPAPLIPAN